MAEPLSFEHTLSESTIDSLDRALGGKPIPEQLVRDVERMLNIMHRMGAGGQPTANQLAYAVVHGNYDREFAVKPILPIAPPAMAEPEKRRGYFGSEKHRAALAAKKAAKELQTA